VYDNATTNAEGTVLGNVTKYDGNDNVVNNGLNESEYAAYALEDGTDTSFPVLSGQADRYEIVINTSVVEGAGRDGVSTGDTVKLEVTSRSGGSTQVILTMPQQLAGKNDNDPIAL
jgi:flagellin FlaB